MLTTTVAFEGQVLVATVEQGVMGLPGRQGPPVPVAHELGDDPALAVSQKLLTDSIAGMEQANSVAVDESTRQAGIAGSAASLAGDKADDASSSAATAASQAGIASGSAVSAGQFANTAAAKASESDLSAQAAAQSAVDAHTLLDDVVIQLGDIDSILNAINGEP